MKHSILSLLLLLGIISFAFSQQVNNHYQKEGELLIATFKKNHYCPKNIDNDFSEKVFQRVLNELDSKKLIFTQNDIQKLSIYKHLIDDDLCGKSWKFLPAITDLYKSRLEGSEKIFMALLDKPLSFKESEFISFSKNDTLFAKDETDLNNRWRLRLKYNVLAHLSNYVDSTQRTFTEEVLKNEASIRARLKIIKTRYVHRILDHPEGYENYVASEFFSAIALQFDPHSQYLSKTQWQNFESSLATDGYSFGFEMSENEQGELEISGLVPGGPAWRSNEIHEGDMLISIRWEGKETMDLLGADLREINEIIGVSNKEKIHLTIKTTTGQSKTVSLIKEKVRDEDNVVRSYILQGTKKIGYISLPGFYTEWENMNDNTNSCSNDVAKEIIKLQKEAIEGLIIDIRYNGGGSLHEGINMSGIFINEGPLFMIKSKDEKPSVVKDPNRGTVYDGPLLVMVNGQSASASELLASTLQDYNRALIVGSPTYGKATGQVIMPLDTALNIGSSEKEILQAPYGLASVTMRKLYRVSGKTAQLKGVQPDIALPDIYDLYDYKESTYKNALESDSVSKKVIYTALSSFPKKTLCDKSETRVSQSKGFSSIKDLTKNKNVFDKQYLNIPLAPEAFKLHTKKMNEWWNSFTKAEKSNSSLYEVVANQYDQELIGFDNFTKEINNSIIKTIHSDIYIEESFLILSDYITIINQ